MDVTFTELNELLIFNPPQNLLCLVLNCVRAHLSEGCPCVRDQILAESDRLLNGCERNWDFPGTVLARMLRHVKVARDPGDRANQFTGPVADVS